MIRTPHIDLPLPKWKAILGVLLIVWLYAGLPLSPLLLFGQSQMASFYAGPPPLDVTGKLVSEYAVEAHGKHFLYRGPDKANGPWKIDHAGHYIQFLPINANATATTHGKGLINKPVQWTDVDVQHSVNDGLIQVLLTIQSADAPTEFQWRLNTDLSVTLNANGSVSLGDSLIIQPPWARDANGQPVEVSVALTGPVGGYYTYMKTVNHVGAAHPVQADPSITINTTAIGSFQGYEAVYNDARGLTASSFTGAQYICGQYTDFSIWRSLLKFDLSTWPGYTLDSAVVQFTNLNYTGTNTEFNWGLIASNTQAFAAANWDQFPGWATGITAYSGIIKYAQFVNTASSAATVTMRLNTTWVDSLTANLAGDDTLAMFMISAEDSAASAPTDREYISTATAPQLILYYGGSPPASGPTVTRAIGTILHNPDPIIRRNLGKILNEVYRNP